ncbi:MAG: ROK family protein [Epulopiscium sp.]|nr:ROK family protein [Candidatus Epulonipiscium sp.]
MKKVIVLDIGGTSIKYGIISEKGNVLFHDETPTEAKKGGAYLMGKVEELVSSLLQKEPTAVGIGISTAGQVDPITGIITFANENLPGWTGMPVKTNLENRFHLPAFVENDVNAAALGELWMGAGKGVKNMLCLTVGTGVGGAIIINGQVYHGATGSAGEFGHLLIKKDGLLCNCGQKGCFEQYASTGAMVRYVKKRYEEQGIDSFDAVNGKWIFQQAAEGDKICQEGIDYMIDHLASGIATLVHIFNPSLIVIGGGISGQGKPLLERIQQKVEEYIMPSYGPPLTLTFATCGNQAGMLGAGYGILNQ